VKLKKIITFTKKSRKKIRNQNNEDQSGKTIPSIWIEWWNWKKIIFLQKDKGKKIETKRKRIKLENTIFGKLKLNDEIENK
jgi:hypothetical protein